MKQTLRNDAKMYIRVTEILPRVAYPAYFGIIFKRENNHIEHHMGVNNMDLHFLGCFLEFFFFFFFSGLDIRWKNL